MSALQLSAARKGTEITDEDLREFAENHLAAGASPSPVEAGDFKGFSIAYRDESHHWRQWFLRSHNVAVFVTYNCPVKLAGEEDIVVNTALSDLRLSNGAL